MEYRINGRLGEATLELQLQQPSHIDTFLEPECIRESTGARDSLINWQLDADGGEN